MDLQPNRSFTKNDLESMLLDEAAEPRALPFSLLENITNNFSYKQEIGRGGFAVVYMGMLENGAVAVKRLSNTYEYETEFLREVECLVKVKHKNIVRFLGYCSDTQGNVALYNGKFVMADIQERLLCFEFLPKGSLDNYIKDASGGLDWKTRYGIIKGICDGLHYLHHRNIMHLDLKPSNVLMDDNMIPKITDFGLSRSLEEMQTRVLATKMFGTLGYLAPEFTSNVITHKFDLYSLGIMIMEILTGAKERQKIEDVLESWDNRSELSQENSHYEQVRVCAEIGIECTNIDPTKRPVSMTNIMDRLAEIERTEVVQAKYSRQLLKVQSLELRFPFNPNMPNACALHLTNNTDKCVAFRLKNTVEESWLKDDFGKLLLYGIVPPRSTYTLLVTTTKETELPRETKIDLSLQTSVAGEDIQPFKRNEECNHYFEQVKKQGDALNEVALKVVCDPQEKIIPFMGVTSWLQCLDAHPTEPWIIFGDFYKQVHIWNYDTQSIDQSFKESMDAVWSTKIIARKQWILAGDVKGYIHVYHYGAKPMKIRSLRSSTCSRITTLAIHPTKSYVLSATFYYIDLWDWDNDWKRTQTFLGHSGTVFQVAFNPRDHDSFVSASWDNTVKVWNLNSPESIFTLSGHSGVVTCLDFFTRDDQQYLITCSSDQTAKIWDMHQKMCIHTIKGFTSPVTCVISLPDRPSLVTGSEDGLVRLWSSSDYRLERIFDIGQTTIVVAVACLKGSNRIVIGQRERVSIMDIDDE